MTQKTQYHCNRCGKTILENRTELRVESGMLRARFADGFDLCKDCAEQFVNWMKSDPDSRPLEKVVEQKDEIPLGPVGRVARRLPPNG
jgi:hypothetical protein